MSPAQALSKSEQKVTLEITANQYQNLQFLLGRAREAKTAADCAQLVLQCTNEAYVATAGAVISDAGGPPIGEPVRIVALRQADQKFLIDISVPE